MSNIAEFERLRKKVLVDWASVTDLEKCILGVNPSYGEVGINAANELAALHKRIERLMGLLRRCVCDHDLDVEITAALAESEEK